MSKQIITIYEDREVEVLQWFRDGVVIHLNDIHETNQPFFAPFEEIEIIWR